VDSSFPEPSGHSDRQLSPKQNLKGALEIFLLNSASPVIAADGAAEMSELRVDRHRDDGRDAVERQLLALHRVRRRMERGAHPGQSSRRESMAIASR